jgi:hypothetical protein
MGPRAVAAQTRIVFGAPNESGMVRDEKMGYANQAGRQPILSFRIIASSLPKAATENAEKGCSKYENCQIFSFLCDGKKPTRTKC